MGERLGLPDCGNVDRDKFTKLEGKAHRPGVYLCNESECRQQFTVTVNTVFESSKIPLTEWLAALFLMTASKKGNQRASDPPYTRHQLQIDVVSYAPPA